MQVSEVHSRTLCLNELINISPCMQYAEWIKLPTKLLLWRIEWEQPALILINDADETNGLLYF